MLRTPCGERPIWTCPLPPLRGAADPVRPLSHLAEGPHRDSSIQADKRELKRLALCQARKNQADILRGGIFPMGLEVRRTVKPKSVQFGLGWPWHPLSFQISGTKRVSQKLLCRSLVSVARLSESASCLPPFLGSYSASSRREQPLGGSEWCFRRPRESLSGPPRGDRSGAQAGVWRAERQWPSW